MENKYPAWLELSALFVLLLNIPLIFLEIFPRFAGSIPIHALEWVFTGAFTIEYFLRIGYSASKRKYVFGVWGLIDLLATLPQYILVFVPGLSELYLLRLLRLVRLVFRLLKAGRSSSSFLHDWLELKKHFSAEEEIKLRLNVTRLYFLGQYMLFGIIGILAAAGAVFFSALHHFDIPLIALGLSFVFLVCVFALLRKELFVLSHRYAVTSHRVLSSTKILEEHVTSVSLIHATDVTFKQSFIQRILNVGTLEIRTSGEQSNMLLPGVRKPLEVKHLIQQNIIALNANQARNTQQPHPST